MLQFRKNYDELCGWIEYEFYDFSQGNESYLDPSVFHVDIGEYGDI